MELEYPFYESDDMIFTVEQDGVNIIYNYYQYGDALLCASENYIRVGELHPLKILTNF